MRKIIILFMLVSGVYFGQGIVNMEASTVPMQHELVIVHSGDTLWNIATRWTSDKEDVREVVYRIQQKNKLQGNVFLQPGQQIIVPVKMRTTMLAER